tara:strand:- start:33167 stop:33628 length:462 start_codon:yes stop_codon:yes gene_type:complete
MTLSPDLRGAYVQMIQDIKPNIAITLNTFPGCLVSDNTMLSRLKHFDAQIARRTLGRRWASKPETDRIHGVYVLEHGISSTHPHWHGFVKVPENQHIRYVTLMKYIWESSYNRSWFEIDSQALEDYTSRAAYVLKEVWAESTDNIVFTNMLRG